MNHRNDTHEPAVLADKTTAEAAIRRRFMMPLAFGAIAAALLVIGIVPRLQASTALTSQAAAQHALSVSVIKPRNAPAIEELLLPGSVMPYADASIYARTSGYLEHWYADIGARVKAGQTLAVIQTPELDAQLQQARADAATAQANFNYSKVSAQRWQDMLKTQSVSQQDTDTKVSDMEAKRAMLQSAQANVQRLSELVSYEKVSAPFDGVVTARNVDVGALVTAGGSPGLAALPGELFHVEQTDTLRVFVDVPQNDAPYVTPGTEVYLSVQQYPGRRFAAKVARSAGAIDPVSRTMHVEVDVDNRDGALLPGAYAQVHLALQNASPALDLPVSALLFRPNGVTVAVVDSTGKTALKTVTIGRDFGTHVEVTTGLTATDRVIDNPGDAISPGEPVQIVSSAS
ncbi:MAG: efflux transporter periplasmic adaptor subunit [Caballeronia sp.]|jgi:membrane fusion protein (multidrug efflux system)|uniref:efflux RND transporter periplasmic adaptor subunit n=1 Tax=Caballeronia sp. TaxID=1931223 RepID=UPI00262D02EA|nr:efflux RND transporter periplasmic adaptor subunit [Caballeronia sp.]MDB5833758.1 efflux transporter periplasmic adaptor subunit [Caballeronia sp.]